MITHKIIVKREKQKDLSAKITTNHQQKTTRHDLKNIRHFFDFFSEIMSPVKISRTPLAVPKIGVASRATSIEPRTTPFLRIVLPASPSVRTVPMTGIGLIKRFVTCHAPARKALFL